MNALARTLRDHWAITLLLACFIALAVATSLLNPLFESTDEIRHYRYVRHLVVEHKLPVQGDEQVRSQSHHPPLYYALCALFSGWVDSPHTPTYEQPPNPFWGYKQWQVGADNKLQYRRDPQTQGDLAALIPRWVNIFLGAVAVLLTYKLGRCIWPQHPSLALASAAIIGFNPQFIYLSAAMNNDIIAAASGTGVLFVSVSLVHKGINKRRLATLGLAYGLALLAKFHLLVLGGIIALAVLFAPTQAAPDSPQGVLARSKRRLWALGLVYALATLLAGWWFARNWQLYGDPSGLNKVNELWAGRPASGNWWALRQGLPYLWSSLWGRFGYGQIPLPQSIYQGLLITNLLALGGYAFTRRSPKRPPAHARVLLLLLVTVLGFMAVVCYYILIQPAGPMGRFLFPALPAWAVLLMDGLYRWPPFKNRPVWSAWGVTLAMGALALLVLGAFLLPAVNYPPRTDVEAATLDVQFGDVARLLDASLRPGALQPGDTLFVDVIWQPLRRTTQPYSVYVHLIDEADVLIAQRDTWPGLGRAPTTAWRLDQPFADSYQIELPAGAYAPNQASVRLGLYESGTGRLPATDDAGELGDGVTVGSIAIQSQPGDWPNPQHSNFDDQITLVGYTLEPRSLKPGETFSLTLYWQVSDEQPLADDYWVFSQVIDQNFQVWGSRDAPGPGWQPGEVVQDVRHITLIPETPAGSYPLQVGLFGKDGRLPVIADDGHYIDERVLLGPIRIRE